MTAATPQPFRDREHMLNCPPEPFSGAGQPCCDYHGGWGDAPSCEDDRAPSTELVSRVAHWLATEYGDQIGEGPEGYWEFQARLLLTEIEEAS